MLHSTSIGEATAPRVAVVHGILGSGLNWRSFCQRLYRRRPDLCFVMVDLRNHGRSGNFDSGNTLRQCALDISELQADGPFEAIVGHSFGGKVALQCAEEGFGALREIWVLDSNPGRLTDHSASQAEATLVMKLLRGVPLPVQRRIEVKEALLQVGASRAIAQWMTTNLEKRVDGYHWRFHLDGVEEMIMDYFRQDLWSVLESPVPGLHCHILRALRSDRWNENLIERLEHLPPRSFYHCIDAGHWVHADNPTDLMDLLAENLLA